MLLDKLPDCYKQIKEIDVIVSEEETNCDSLSLAVSNLEDDQFVLTATAYGLEKREQILGLQALSSDTIDDRRTRIIMEYNKYVPYTESTLNRALEMICGTDEYKLEVNYTASSIKVRINLSSKNSYQAVENYLEEIVPLNMIIDLSLLYNQYSTLEKFTYDQLSAYTYDQLREEVLS